ncbi:MAG: hypothetical protein LBU24_03190 [Methanocalculaceae archaeon]|jgi:hypothetical protein|nr:hypothetical protein [Methanocalculaceae archaeon]
MEHWAIEQPEIEHRLGVSELADDKFDKRYSGNHKAFEDCLVCLQPTDGAFR